MKKHLSLFLIIVLILQLIMPSAVFAQTDSPLPDVESLAEISSDLIGEVAPANSDETTSDPAETPDTATPAAETPTPEVPKAKLGSGNLNMDIDLTPDVGTILSGQTATYNLTFKVTGSVTQFKNANITVSLPGNAVFFQPLSELEIAGVQPVYDRNSKTLTYSFPALATGQVYTTKIKTIPPNGSTPNGALLEASAAFSASGMATVTSNASIKVKASASIALSKKYTATTGKSDDATPIAGDSGIWTIALSIPKSSTGQLFINEDSKIVITDTLPAGTSYISNDANGVYNPETNTVTWTYDAPSDATQTELSGNLFEKKIQLELRFEDISTDFSTINNTAEASFMTIDGQTITKDASASREIARVEGYYPAPDGTWVTPVHLVEGGVTTPVVYDWNKLWFTTQFGIAQDFVTTVAERYKDIFPIGFKTVTQEYNIDPNLNLEFLETYLPRYHPTSNVYAPLQPLPAAYVAAKVNNEWLPAHQLNYTGLAADQPLSIPLSSLGVSAGTHVQAVSITYKDVSGGLSVNFALSMDFGITKGYTGKVTNSIREYGVLKDDREFTVTIPASGNAMSPLSATVISADDSIPIAKNQIHFKTANGNEITAGSNTVSGTFANTSASLQRMEGPFTDYVLLPVGVTVNEANTAATFKNNTGTSAPANGSLEIVTNNYQDTQRQLVKLQWTAKEMLPRQHLAFSFDVNVSKDTPSPVNLESFGFSGDAQLNVPEDASATASALEYDTDDMNGNSNTNEYRVKASNTYVMNTISGLVTNELVKGELDTDYTTLGHTVLGGDINYQLNIHSVSSSVINNMTLIDVLPSVGDLGITDGANRGSMFTPTLTGPITVPDEWQQKVTVTYSEATNPKRDDLDKNTIYPASTQPLSNPVDAEEPNWLEESMINDWSQIHSFKIELAPGITWAKGSDMQLQYTMKAPETLAAELTTPAKDEASQAAWNSFAYAANHSQVVEPSRVGVVVTTKEPNKPDDPSVTPTPEDPTKPSVTPAPQQPVVTKTVNGKESYQANSLNNVFHYAVNFSFGKQVADWEAVRLIDDLTTLAPVNGVNVQDVLQFLPRSITITDENGASVVKNGSLSSTKSKIVFDIGKQDDSYQFLAGHTYTLTVDAKLNASATAAQLAAFREDSNGIPNTATLNIQTDGVWKTTSSNTVYVTTPKNMNLPPSAYTTGNHPKTGDNTMILALVLLLAISGVLLGFVLRYRKKKTK